MVGTFTKRGRVLAAAGLHAGVPRVNPLRGDDQSDFRRATQRAYHSAAQQPHLALGALP